LERKAGARLEPDFREASFETPQEVAGERGDPQDVRTDPQKALLPAWRSASGLDRTGGSLKHDPGVLEKSLARGGEIGASAVAREQGDTQLALQRPDLLGEPRLSEPKALGSSPEMTLFGHGDEVFQLTKLQVLHLCGSPSGSVESKGGFAYNSGPTGSE